MAKKCIKYLNSKSFEFETSYLKSFDDAYKFSLEANIGNYDNIIAVGGDGTINKVINGFYDNNGRRNSNARFGVIYTGTSPDFCKSYGIPIDIYKSCDVIMNQKAKEIPVGMIKFKKDRIPSGLTNNEEKVRYFACCANIGLGSMLAEKANSGIRKYLGDFMGTLLSLIQILTFYKGKNYQVYVDNEFRDINNVINISVGITPYIASGIKVSANPERDYKQLYMMTASNVKFKNIYNLLKQIYSGKLNSKSDTLKFEYAQKVIIQAESIAPEIEFDGDPAGFLPCTIEIAKDKLKVLSV